MNGSVRGIRIMTEEAVMTQRLVERVGRFSRLSVLVVCACALVLAAVPTFADGGGKPRILPPNSEPYDRTYGEWSAKWWQFIFAIPATDQHPLLAEDVDYDCSVGQSGKVWFLTGKFCLNQTECGVHLTATRSCTITEGTALFFPVANSENDNVLLDGTIGHQTTAHLRAGAESFQDAVSRMSAWIDGAPVRGLSPAATSRYRVLSPVFKFLLPADNLYAFLGVPVPAGVVRGAVADGAYLMLAPLSVGNHTIRFAAGFDFLPPDGTEDFSFDITYNVKVVPSHHHDHQ